MENRDVEAILAIQSASPEIAQWSMADYVRAAQGEMVGWVADEDIGIIGFLVARQIANEIEILNFAVRQGARGKGVGASLLREAFSWAKALGAIRAFLEVRASNSAALRFYEHQGFAVTGRRPRYYADPVEDALVLAAPLH